MTLKYFNVKNGLVTGNITLDASNSNATANYFIGNISVTNKANLGANANVTITGGTSGQLLATDGAGNLYWAAPAGGGGIGGSNTQVQFNDSGTYGGSSNFTFDKTSGLVTASHFSGEAGNLSNIVGANVTGAVSYASTANSVAGSNVSGAVAYATTANSVAGANVTGQVGNALVAGTVYTAAQPNITSVGTLTSLDVSGGLTVGGNLTVNGTLTSINSTIVEIDDLAIVLANDASTSTQANGAGIIINGASANMLYISSTNSFTFSHKISADGGLLSNIIGANVTGAVSYASTANSVAGANVTGQVGYAAVANSVAVANVSGIGNIATINKDGNASNVLYGNGVFSSLPTMYSNANVATFLASFGSNTVNTTGNITAAYFIGNGSELSSLTGANVTGAVSYATTANLVAGANVSGQVGNALVAGTVYTAAQPNITSVGTLTSLSVTGNITSGNANLGNLATANFFSGNGHYLTDILGTQISGEVAFANKANYVSGSNVSGAVSYATTANSVAGANVSGEVSFAATANSVAGANVTGAVSYATTANSVAGANVTGQVGNATVAGTVYTNAQPNITSVGTLTSLTVSGTSTLGAVGNVKITGGTTGQYLQTDGTGNLSWATVTASGGVSGSNTQVIYNDAGSYAGDATFTYDKTTTTLTANNFVVSTHANLGAPANITITGGTSGQVLKTDGSGNLSWTTAAGSESTVTSVDTFTGDGTTVDFTLSVTPANKNQTTVNYNGAMQLRSAYTLSGNVITFSEAPANGAVFEVTTQMGVTTGAGSLTVRTYTGDGSNVAFSVSSGVDATNILVTDNGILQTPTTDYTVSGGTLTFGTAPVNGSHIQIRELGTAVSTITPAGSNTQVLFNDAGGFGNSASFTFDNTSNKLTVTHIQGEGGNISNVAGANVSGEVSYAAVANSVAVANVSGIGNVAIINKDGNAGNILYGNGVFAAPPAPGTSNARNIINSYVFGS